MLSSLRSRVHGLLESRGYRVERVGPTAGLVGPPRRELGQSYLQLARLGARPATVIDVGAASGTPELLNAFPQAGLVMFEPLEEFRHPLVEIAATRSAAIIEAAAGPEAGSITFHVHPDQLEGSSSLQETMGDYADGVARTVPMVRVDEAFDRTAFPGPYLLKIDVQGAELSVLAGCTGILPETMAICLEVSLFSFMKGAPQFTEVIHAVADHGFVAWDIVPGWTRPLDGALGQVDILFVPKDSPLRHDHSFATAEQYRQLTGQGL